MTRSWTITPDDPVAPPQLAEVHPRCERIYGIGDQNALEHSLRVAIVGSRRARSSSLVVARKLAQAASRAGAVVVSGLAMGVDTAAHEGALRAGGSTIAVCGSGLGYVHPRSNVELAQRIHAPGSRSALVSEYGMGADAPAPWQFRARNRIIAALATYVVIVQAAPRSGSLGTAADALELGVPIGVVPGGIGDAAFAGSHALIRDGADCILDESMLLAHLGVTSEEAALPHETELFGGVLAAPRTPSELVGLLELPLADIRRMLIDAELAGAVRRLADGSYVVCSA